MTKLVTINDRTMSRSAWARELGISLPAFSKRVNQGLTGEELLKPAREFSKEYEYHGMTNTSIYKAWVAMRNRCSNKRNRFYSGYGGRGISVCEEWNNSFQSFYNWSMSNGYKEELTIDRIENNGNYEPNNCRWVTMEVQSKNKRNNIYVEIDGVSKTLTEWAKESGLKKVTVFRRYHAGWKIEDLLKPISSGN
jgi:hypothetical protein